MLLEFFLILDEGENAAEQPRSGASLGGQKMGEGTVEKATMKSEKVGQGQKQTTTRREGVSSTQHLSQTTKKIKHTIFSGSQAQARSGDPSHRCPTLLQSRALRGAAPSARGVAMPVAARARMEKMMVVAFMIDD